VAAGRPDRTSPAAALMQPVGAVAITRMFEEHFV